MGENNFDKIYKWFSTHDTQPQPHYKATYESVNGNKMDTSVDKFEGCCPRAFKKNLRKSPCDKEGSPKEKFYSTGLHKMHNKKKHYTNPSKKELPYCPADSDEHFASSKLRTHIGDQLSPNIEKKKGFGASDDEARQRIECTKSITSSGCETVPLGKMSSRVKEIDCNLKLDKNSFSENSSCSTRLLQASDKPKITKQKIRRSSTPKTSPPKNSRSSKLALVKNILLPRKRAVVKKNTGFVYTVAVCSLCWKIFRLKIALRNHQTKEICSFMTGKTCSYCHVQFNQFSILSCVLHLMECKEKPTGR